MNFLVYILVYPFIWLLSMLPFRILYGISDGVYLLVYYVIGYRKKVVLSNLKLAFPKKSDKEIIEISKKFYHHFADVFIEMIKFFTVSKQEVYKRYKFTNIEFFGLHIGLSFNLASIHVAFSHFICHFRWCIFIGILCNWLPKKSGFIQFKVGISGKI